MKRKYLSNAPLRRKPPDTCPSWRDPNLPVLAHSKSEGQRYVAPEVMTKVSKHRMDWDPAPHYRDDPTYNMKRKPK